jgi:hypothetical protein
VYLVAERKRSLRSARLWRSEPEFRLPDLAAPLGQCLFGLGQVPVAIVERGRAVVDVLLSSGETRVGQRDMSLAVGDVGLTHLDPGDGLLEPRAPLVQLGRDPGELAFPLAELAHTGFAFLESSLVISRVPQPDRELRLADGELRRAAVEALGMLGRARGLLVELARAFVEPSLAISRLRDTRLEVASLCLELAILDVQVSRSCLQLCGARVELPKRGPLEALLLGELLLSPLELRLTLDQKGLSVLVRLERRRRGREPLATLLELGRERPQLARAEVELALTRTHALDLCLRAKHVLLAVAQLLQREREAPLPFRELSLGLLDELRTRVQVGGDLVEAARAGVDFRGLTIQRVPELPFVLGERRPGLCELVLLFGHDLHHDVAIRAQECDLQSIYFDMRGLFVPAALAFVFVSSSVAAPLPPRNLGCGAGKLVLNVTYRVLNDVDTGVEGNNWAFDNYLRTVRVWRKAAGRYCSASTYSGDFTSIAGLSPGGKVQIPAGIRGTFKGSSTTRFRGTLTAGDEPTRGFLGVKDFACTSADQKGECSGTWDWLRSYFTGISAFRYVKYAFSYHATEGGKGTWSDALVGGKIRFSGDIRPLKGNKP